MSATEEKAPPRTATVYLILSLDEDGSWNLVARQSASNDSKAIHAYVSESGDEKGTFVAVPVRSWRERTISVENTPRVRVG